jgi:hypothetical protein
MADQTEDKIITFESYYDPMLAHIIRTKLEDNGIHCFIADENMIGANPLYNQAVGGVKLKIFERDLQQCKDILAEDGDLHEQDHFEIDQDTDTAVICPYCASTNVSYGITTEKKSNWLTGLLSTLFTPFASDKQWHCFNCQRNFE